LRIPISSCLAIAKPQKPALHGMMENVRENKQDKSTREICPNARRPLGGDTLKKARGNRNATPEGDEQAYPSEIRSFVDRFFVDKENGRVNPLKELLSFEDQLQVCGYLMFVIQRDRPPAPIMEAAFQGVREIALNAGKLASAIENLEGLDRILRDKPLFRLIPSQLRLLEKHLKATFGTDKKITKPSQRWNDVWLVCASLIVENRTKSWHDADLLELIQTRLRYGMDDKEGLDKETDEPHISKKRDRVIKDTRLFAFCVQKAYRSIGEVPPSPASILEKQRRGRRRKTGQQGRHTSEMNSIEESNTPDFGGLPPEAMIRASGKRSARPAVVFPPMRLGKTEKHLSKHFPSRSVS
jgi:hypothetical protein